MWPIAKKVFRMAVKKGASHMTKEKTKKVVKKIAKTALKSAGKSALKTSVNAAMNLAGGRPQTLKEDLKKAKDELGVRLKESINSSLGGSKKDSRRSGALVGGVKRKGGFLTSKKSKLKRSNPRLL